jgi:hypothetical protein
VGIAFHLFGVGAAPHLLLAAAIAALIAAGVSLTRLGAAPPTRVAEYRPILD